MTRNNHSTEGRWNLTITRKQVIAFFTGMFIMGVSIFKFSLLNPFNFLAVAFTTMGSFGFSIGYLSKFEQFKGYYRTRYTIFAVFTAVLGTVLVALYGLPMEVMVTAVTLLAVLGIVPFLVFKS